MPDTVLIANKPFWARILAPFWVIETGSGLVFAWVGSSWLGGEENGVAWVLIAGGLLLAVAGVIMARLSWRVARLADAALELSDAGLLDRRLSPDLIPWEAIAWKVVFNGRSYSLQFDLTEPQRSGLAVYWDQKLVGRFNRLFGFPEFTAVTLGTGLTAHHLGECFSQFRPETRR
ncbi:hypothetical protein [Aestuariivirga sp.]|uniref:hypothetical protein n=1 Tax=Aestuariivirga sp. TaxID=2650926 RepID=UPI0035933890